MKSNKKIAIFLTILFALNVVIPVCSKATENTTNTENLLKEEVTNNTGESNNEVATEEAAEEEVEKEETKLGVEYFSHVQDYGWEQDFKYKNGEASGTTGKNKKIEAMKIRLINGTEGSSIRYKAYVQGKGWQAITKDGGLAGTMGQNRKMEAIQIDLVGLDNYSVKYRVHVQNKGWLDWCYDGDISGVVEEGLKIEAIQIEIVDKVHNVPAVAYRSHVQDTGWERAYVSDGQTSGTTGKNRKVEAFQLQLKNGGSIDSYLKYKTYVEGIGWQRWRKDLEISGTTGKNKRIFAIRIELEGMPGYSVVYRVHRQNIGWKNDWQSDGQTAGSSSSTMKIEAIEIKIVKTEEVDKKMYLDYYSYVQDYGWEEEYSRQDGEITGTTGRSKKIEGIKLRLKNATGNAKIKYRAYVEGIGWQDWSSDGELAGTTGKNKKIFGIRIELEGLEDYSVQYRAHIQDIGWQSWKADGLTAGAIGKSRKIEAIIIKLVPKVKITTPSLEFYSYIQNQGWEDEFFNQSGEFTGLPGKGKCLESIKIRLKNAPQNASVKYKLHISEIGWTDWYSDGEEAGTPGSGKKIEAIQIKLDNMNSYTVEYKTYVQGLGWQGLRQDGKSSGTTGKNLRVEGMMIDLVGKYKSEFTGIDISKHNGTIDFGSLITNNNLDFMIIRVGYGRNSYQLDEQFERNYSLAKAYGIPIGAYLYSYATDVAGARAEAQNMLNWIRGKTFELPVFYDIEDPTQKGSEKRELNTQMCNEFCGIISNAGYKAGIYSGKYFANNYINMNNLSTKYALWIAAYGNKTDGTMPAASYKYQEYHDIWQYSSSGSMAGINGRVDMNICYNATYFGRR